MVEAPQFMLKNSKLNQRTRDKDEEADNFSSNRDDVTNNFCF